MSTFIALLRGINVGGHRKILMSALKQVHEALGHDNPVTYLQSGNVVFDCDDHDHQALRQTLMSAYDRAFGFPVDVILRTADDLVHIADGNPFPHSGGREARFLHVFMLSGTPGGNAIETFSALDRPEEVQAAGDILYVYYPQGAGRSKLTLNVVEKALGVTATARNWNTVTKLLELVTQR